MKMTELLPLKVHSFTFKYRGTLLFEYGYMCIPLDFGDMLSELKFTTPPKHGSKQDSCCINVLLPW